MNEPGSDHIMRIRHGVPAQKLVTFFVPGKPATAGSKNLYRNNRTGKMIVAPSCKRAPVWSAEVKAFALKAWRIAPVDGPLGLIVECVMARPQRHYGKGRNAGGIKPDAEYYHITTPDLTKMVRCLEDAITKIVWRDDSQVAVQVNMKRYVNPDETPGVIVSVFSLKEP